LITQDGQACLGDFGVTATFAYLFEFYQPETLRYTAPERITYNRGPLVGDHSEESDVYSVAMTSFSVRTSFWKASYYLKRSFLYNQVLTGVIPYHGRNVKDMITDIYFGERPPHTTNTRSSRLSQPRVWDVITTGWSHEPKERCELSAMHNAFLASGQRGQGDLSA